MVAENQDLETETEEELVNEQDHWKVHQECEETERFLVTVGWRELWSIDLTEQCFSESKESIQQTVVSEYVETGCVPQCMNEKGTACNLQRDDLEMFQAEEKHYHLGEFEESLGL